MVLARSSSELKVLLGVQQKRSQLIDFQFIARGRCRNFLFSPLSLCFKAKQRIAKAE
jgi:hypothetical protein